MCGAMADMARRQKSVGSMIAAKKMPQVLQLGANPPFQRVEETSGACKKARLFTIVRAFLLRCSKITVSKSKNL
jgi:hypothetical protein